MGFHPDQPERGTGSGLLCCACLSAVFSVCVVSRVPCGYICVSMHISVSVLGARGCACWVYVLSLTTGWTWGHEVVAASPRMGCWVWQLLTGTVQTTSCEFEEPGGSMNPFTEKNSEGTSTSFPVMTLEEGYEARTA